MGFSDEQRLGRIDEWQANDEAAAASWLAFDPNRTGVHIHQFARDSQPHFERSFRMFLVCDVHVYSDETAHELTNDS